MRYSLLFLLCVYPLIFFASSTQLKFYRPFGDVVDQVKPNIVMQKHGTCLEQSKVIVREEAWRCIADQITYDPCFIKAPGERRQALCLQSPWRADAVSLDLSNVVDSSHQKPLDASSAYPWAVQLMTGVNCLATDQNKTINGALVHYICTDHTVLFGHLQRCKTEWTMLQQNQSGVISTVSIKKAWF